MKSDTRWAFFGTAPLAEATLDELEKSGFLPQLIVATPDVVVRRGKEIVAPPEKIWAQKRGIHVMQPQKCTPEIIRELSGETWDVFVVASYGKLLPTALLKIPTHGVLNVHPSLLPRLRGASPIRTAILRDEKTTGVSIILLDAELDHGPLLAQRAVAIPEWPPRGRDLDAILAKEGGTLLAQILPHWLAGDIEAHEQNHDVATYCDKIKKEDGLLDLHDDAYINLLKVRAFEGWPGTYAFFERSGKRLRVTIVDAHLSGNKLIIDTVKPEGKKEMPYEDFLRSGVTPQAQN